MIYQGINKFEYKYIKLSTSIQRSVELLNIEGFDGWELIKLFEPQNALLGDPFKALLKRRITEIKV